MAHRKPPFFYVDDRGDLAKEEIHHLRDVLRRDAGDRIEISDGKGVIRQAEILTLTHDRATFRIISESPPVEPPTLTLATAVPKGERMLFLVEKAAEMGCGRIVPLITRRSSVRRITPGMVRRWNARAVAAGKQAHRPWMCVVEDPIDLTELLQREAAFALLDNRGDFTSWQRIADHQEWTFIIGPEGGWTREERATLSQSVTVTLPVNTSVLRTETAAAAGVALYSFTLSVHQFGIIDVAP